MRRGDLGDAEWSRLEPHLLEHVGRGGSGKRHRTVVDAILFRLRNGAAWRDPPRASGRGRWCATVIAAADPRAARGSRSCVRSRRTPTRKGVSTGRR
ncbi:transposase [Streptomyces sp. NRRL B-1347]|uniref:transposase n=1 Tax=Streptomyces sp. NRRL B-1347 TaxID=1476877 RepID=UPI003B63411D